MVVSMKKTRSQKQPSVTTQAVKRKKVGRPRVEEPKVTMSLRFSGEMIAALDAWAQKNGEIGRSNAVRQAVAKMVREDGRAESS